MNQRRTEPEEDERVPTEDGEVQAEPVEMQGEVREEPVDWTEDGEDLDKMIKVVKGYAWNVHRPCICILVKAKLKVKIFKENTNTEHLKLDENLDVKN